MINKITEDDLIFFQTLSHPVSCGEILFHDFDNLGAWDTEKFGKIRMYQYSMISFDSLFLADQKLSNQENFNVKNGMAESYNLGGRLTGKSAISIVLDGLVAIFNKTFKWAVISSYDKLHVQEAFEKMIIALENHPIMRMLNSRILRSPTYKITTESGLQLESVNMNITGKEPGAQFFGKHIDKHWMEESSFITKSVSGKLLMAQSELGCINRFSGMTTFSKHSPMGKIFLNLKNKGKITNLPSYVNPTWNNKKEEESIQEFGGRESTGYKVQIEGKVVEDCDSVYDIERIRKSYHPTIEIKSFEVTKDNFFRYAEDLILERPDNVDFCYLCADIGEGAAPSEVIIIFKIKDKYKYVYNITLNRLSSEEQYDIFKWMIDKINANIVGLDTTSGGGKALANRLTPLYPKNIIWVSFSSKTRIGFEKDKEGNIVTDESGKPKYKEEYVFDWSIQRLKHLFYNEKMECYIDYKLDIQFSNVIAVMSGIRMNYDTKGADHLHQAFQVFGIVEWQAEFSNLKPVGKRKLCGGSFGK